MLFKLDNSVFFFIKFYKLQRIFLTITLYTTFQKTVQKSNESV